MKPAALALVLLALLPGCGSDEPAPPAGQAVYGAAPSAAPAPVSAAATSTAVPPASAAPALGAGLLEYPHDVQMILLALRLAGGDPAATIATWAEASDDVRRANEFQRDAALAGETRRLEALLAAVADTGRLRIKTSTQLGEYDAAAGVWYLSAFQPGSVFTFLHQRQQASLAMSNTREGYRWPMAADEAEALKRKTQYRSIEVDIDLVITGARMRSNGPQIDTRITEYRLRTTGGDGSEIGHVTLQ